MGLLKYEDFPAGEIIEYGAYKITAGEIISFALEYDPQAFHTDPEAAKTLMLGGHAASGWHTAAIGMRINFDGFVRASDSWGGPGVEELRWLRPVRPGDVLSVRRRTLGRRVSKSRPEMGFVEFMIETLNQRRETVMTQHWFFMIGRRAPGSPDPHETPPYVAKPLPPLPPVTAAPPEGAQFFDDVPLGMRRAIGWHTFKSDDIIRFARAYDPQPFHLSEEGAAKSHFGQLAASGWHTACVWMKLMIAERDRRDAGLLERGLRLPAPGPSPGFRQMRWNAPVFSGDTVTYDSIIAEKRVSASRPGWGLVFFHNSGVNQHGVKVFEFRGSAFWERRGV